MQKNIPVTIPQSPKNFLGLPRFAQQTRRAIKELAQNMPAPARQTAFGSTCPFRLEAISGSTCYWRVSSTRSHIINGTNGPIVDLTDGGADWKVGGITFDTLTEIAATRYICLQAAVSSLATSDWELVAVDPATPSNADEVGIDEDSMSPTYGEQIWMRLLIGKIVYDAPSSTVVAHQAVFSPQRVTYGIFNAIACKVFEPAHIHRDFLGV